MFTPDALVDEVPLRSSLTPATRMGALPEGVLALLALSGLGWATARSVRARNGRKGAAAAAPEDVPAGT
jgi:apolipoprotein N-acyltransferase